MAVRLLQDKLDACGASLLIVGDSKGPAEFNIPTQLGTFYSVKQQNDLPYALGKLLPFNHYARKNLGYLEAMRYGASCIYETDDDNAPNDLWQPRAETIEVSHAVAQGEWLNAYQLFSESKIWPRGFPLDQVLNTGKTAIADNAAAKAVLAPIQQGLADNSPDVDAVWRFVLDEPFTFNRAPSVAIPTSQWCPFNSQSTWWWPRVYPLMYLPSYCSFRVTDIWRSFIAQRCLWEIDAHLVFHAPEVIQHRNEHDLMKDFVDELPGYLRNNELISILSGLSLTTGEDHMALNLLNCYRALIDAAFFPHEEGELVAAWIADCHSITQP